MPSGDPLSSTIAWIMQLLVGKLATTIAVIAVAGFGLATLQGRFAYRDCVQVVTGCALIFGASMIARGFMDMTSGSEFPVQATSVEHPLVTFTPRPAHYDPYAGASVPQ